MKIIEPGHIYQLEHQDGTCAGILVFVNREEGTEHEGTQTQEILRALIDRTQHCDNCLRWGGNDKIIQHLRMALALHESRAIERKTEKGELKPEEVPTDKDGHFAIPSSDPVVRAIQRSNAGCIDAMRPLVRAMREQSQHHYEREQTRAEQAAEKLDTCFINMLSSRVCTRGTKSCTLDHTNDIPKNLIERDSKESVVPNTIGRPAEPLGEPKTSDYCLACGQSPDSAKHGPFFSAHDYVDPRMPRQLSSTPFMDTTVPVSTPYRCNVPMCGESGVCEECKKRGAR